MLFVLNNISSELCHNFVLLFLDAPFSKLRESAVQTEILPSACPSPPSVYWCPHRDQPPTCWRHWQSRTWQSVSGPVGSRLWRRSPWPIPASWRRSPACSEWSSSVWRRAIPAELPHVDVAVSGCRDEREPWQRSIYVCRRRPWYKMGCRSCPGQNKGHTRCPLTAETEISVSFNFWMLHFNINALII